MEKKFELTDQTHILPDGTVLHRIRAIANFGTVKAGELGGYIEKEDNLSQTGDAWVYGNAWVSGNAQVCENAQVYGDAWVSGKAQVYEYAQVYGDAWVYGKARVCGNAGVGGNAQVSFWYRENFHLTDTSHFVFKNSWSSLRDFFYNPVTRLWSVGCFLGTSEELIKKAYADSEESGRMYEKYVEFAEALATEEVRDEKS